MCGGGVLCKVIFMSKPTKLMLGWGWVGVLIKLELYKKGHGDRGPCSFFFLAKKNVFEIPGQFLYFGMI